MGTYLVNLLGAIHTARPQMEMMLFSDSVLPRGAAYNGFRPQVVGPTRGYRWQLWERVALPLQARWANADLLHSPANTTPSFSTMPRVVTVHDVIPYLPHVAASPLRGRYWTHVIPRAVRRADGILTDSEASATDIARLFDISPSRIHVASLAVGSDVQVPSGDVRSMLDELGVREPYVLGLAASAPRKNTVGVLRVFARALRANRNLQLVLTGVTRELRPRIVAVMTDLGVPSTHVRLLEFVDVPQRNALYSRAAVFVFLSLYEGFGLPILEAMRCGAPVLCSNRSSCPEVAGDAALVVDPTDEHAAASALLRLVGASASDRRQWQSRGWAREQRFSWKRTAELTLSVYDRIIG